MLRLVLTALTLGWTVHVDRRLLEGDDAPLWR